MGTESVLRYNISGDSTKGQTIFPIINIIDFLSIVKRSVKLK